MRKTLFFLLLFLVSSCRKDAAVQSGLTLQQVVSKAIGYYKINEVCTQNNGNNTFTVDSFNNVSLIISTADDSTIIMEGTVLYFSGNLSTATYSFYSPASGGGYNAVFDSTLHYIQFGISANGLGGGGCSGSGSK